jgi:voltage-gated potassium channel
LRELKAGAPGELPVVVVAQFGDDNELIERTLRRPDVHCVNADFTTMEALDKAGVRQASTAVILSDRRGGRSEQDADARTLLAALTIERMNPRVHTCAELNNRDYGAHLQVGGVNDFVVGGEHSAILLARAALHRGITGLVTGLLTAECGNQFYKLPLPTAWVGRTFDELLPQAKQEHEAILVAVEDGQGATRTNPVHYTFQEGDKVVVIATKPPEL